MDQQSPNPSLKRELGLLEVTLSGVGIILGAGIYVLIGQGRLPGLPVMQSGSHLVFQR